MIGMVDDGKRAGWGLQRLTQRCKRAGITTNKGHGQSKRRRQMAKASRRINRK